MLCLNQVITALNSSTSEWIFNLELARIFATKLKYRWEKLWVSTTIGKLRSVYLNDSSDTVASLYSLAKL